MQFHFRDNLTMANLIPTLSGAFPELEHTFLENQNDPYMGSRTPMEVFIDIFYPFLDQFLKLDQKHPNLLGKRLFHFLELMARSPEWPVTNILAVTILEHINPGQLEVAQKYMGPKTKEVLQDIQDYNA